MSVKAKIDQAIEILHSAQTVVALTGAGISMPSGIPDFRSPGSGMWDKYDPFQVASIYAFRRQPEVFYEWIRPMLDLTLSAQPNPAHIALAQLEKAGLIKSVITQNIDGLHQKAGSQVVFEVHGHLREVTCIRCYAVEAAEPFIKKFLQGDQAPACPHCGGIIKPNVILFGEQLPVEALLASQMAACQSDVMIVAGSSLTVVPACNLPVLTRERGGKLIIVNLTPTHLDDMAEVVIHADVAEALPKLAGAFV